MIAFFWNLLGHRCNLQFRNAFADHQFIEKLKRLCKRLSHEGLNKFLSITLLNTEKLGQLFKGEGMLEIEGEHQVIFQLCWRRSFAKQALIELIKKGPSDCIKAIFIVKIIMSFCNLFGLGRLLLTCFFHNHALLKFTLIFIGTPAVDSKEIFD